MERYSEYKDSGVQWLGEIPGHWGHVALSKISEIILGKMLQGETKKGTDMLFPYICAKDVHFDGIDVSDLKTMYFSQSEMDLYGVRKGDMLIVEGGAGAGNCSILREEVKNTGIQNSIMIVRSNADALSNYICYFMSSIVRKGYVDFITNVATIPHFTKEKVSRTNIPLPPLSEQHSIVSYLDDKCGKIDKMLEGKQKQIELLAEMKQRIIADAVTHGLNPDVKMKATNIPWLPEIPEHWELCRLKSLFSQRTESYNPNEQLEVLSLLKDVGVIPYSEKGNVGNKAKEDFSSYRIARKGDVIMNSMNVIIGSVDITQYDGYISPAYYALTAKHGVSTEYYNYIFHMKACQKHMRSLANGILEIRLRISATSLFGMYYPVPPQEEQIAIVSFINEKVVKIDTLTSKLQQEIESIKEYKQRLISDVVTGQIKIC